MKGLAVTQIIMLVLGIIVLAVIGFLLYSNFLSSSGQVSASSCRAKATGLCQNAVLSQTQLTYLNIPECADKTTGACNFDPSLLCNNKDNRKDVCVGIVGTPSTPSTETPPGGQTP